MHVKLVPLKREPARSITKAMQSPSNTCARLASPSSQSTLGLPAHRITLMASFWCVAPLEFYWGLLLYFFLDKKVTKNQGLQRATLRSTAEPLWPAERNRFESIQL
jgi:hypothetical protein